MMNSRKHCDQNRLLQKQICGWLPKKVLTSTKHEILPNLKDHLIKQTLHFIYGNKAIQTKQ